GLFQAQSVETATAAAQSLPELERAAAVFTAKDHAWRSIFWMCLTPGVVFTVGCLMLSESPRWLAQRGDIEGARKALLRTRPAAEAEDELRDISNALAPVTTKGIKVGRAADDKLLSRRYMLPFLLACLVLALTQATGINSILAYVVNILNQAGLPGATANMADVVLKMLNAVMTVVAVVLVDRKGRKFLLMLGTAGIVIALLTSGLLFQSVESDRRDVAAVMQARVQNEGLELRLDGAALKALGVSDGSGAPQQLTVAYSYGPFTNVQTRRSDDAALPALRMTREDTVQADSVIGVFFRKLHLNPFADPAEGATAPLRITQAHVAAVPSTTHGWQVALAMCLFVASFAVGPGVCVWLALSELMPTRIRSNGMSIALLINQFVSTVIAAVFLPTVGQYGYATMFFYGAGCTVLYFLTAAFLLPETKGKTLEEIEGHFAR
ncbi:MAG: MFS transporter, partial [Telluria sp.]